MNILYTVFNALGLVRDMSVSDTDVYFKNGRFSSPPLKKSKDNRVQVETKQLHPLTPRLPSSSKEIS